MWSCSASALRPAASAVSVSSLIQGVRLRYGWTLKVWVAALCMALSSCWYVLWVSLWAGSGGAVYSRPPWALYILDLFGPLLKPCLALLADPLSHSPRFLVGFHPLDVYLEGGLLEETSDVVNEVVVCFGSPLSCKHID